MNLIISNLSFGYKKGNKVLDDINLTVEQGEVLGILGPNGTGKTTFIKCINKILKPQAGKITYDGCDLLQLKQEEIAKIIAYVPQYIGGFFDMTVVDAVMMGRLPYAKYNYSKTDEAIVFDIINKMELTPFAFRSIKEMSGGERQRVFIARALAQQPKIIVLDEPTSALDLHNQLFILHTIADVAKTNNISIVMTIHDLNLASMFCDKILMLNNTHIFAYGKTQDVLNEYNINNMYRVNTRVTLEEHFKHIRLLKEL